MTDRVPTTTPRESWSVETVLDHLLGLLEAADKRYEQRFLASEKALDLGFSGQKAAVDAAFSAQKDAINTAFSAQKDAINAALASADRAVSKAEMSSEKRFEGVNEFRAQLGDQQRTLMPRTEAEKLFGALAEKIAVLENFRTEMLSKGSGAKEGYGLAIGIVGLVLVLLSILSVGFALFSRLSP